MRMDRQSISVLFLLENPKVKLLAANHLELPFPSIFSGFIRLFQHYELFEISSLQINLVILFVQVLRDWKPDDRSHPLIKTYWETASLIVDSAGGCRPRFLFSLIQGAYAFYSSSS